MIRRFEEEDAPAAVALLRGVAVDWATSPAGLRHRLVSHPPRARQVAWVAEDDGALVGFARSRLRWEVSERCVGLIWLGVRRDRRGAGIGSALHERAEGHLREAGAEVLESFSAEEGGRRFLEGLGYRQTGAEDIAVLDVGAADLSALPPLEAEKASEGFRLARLAEVLDRARELHGVYTAGLADVPEEFTVDDVRYEEWERECLGDPDLAAEGSTVVLAGERPVSFALVVADGEGRAANDMTGTLPAFRRRGLARLAKLGTIRWAAASEVGSIVTSNAEENAGIRALNAGLGYRRIGTQTFFLREDLS